MLFYRSSRHTLTTMTTLFNFAWPAAAALWNLRYQVNGFLQACPDCTEEELRSRFLAGSELPPPDFRTACQVHSWNDQQQELTVILLTNAVAVFESWLDATLPQIVKTSEVRRLSEWLQTPHDPSSPSTKSHRDALKTLRHTSSIGHSFYATLAGHRKNSLTTIDSLYTCYRFFKECRNSIAHRGRRANDR